MLLMTLTSSYNQSVGNVPIFSHLLEGKTLLFQVLTPGKVLHTAMHWLSVITKGTSVK